MELTATGVIDIYTMIKTHGLGWAGHVQRQEDSRLSKNLCSTPAVVLPIVVNLLKRGSHTASFNMTQDDEWLSAACSRDNWGAAF